jgi:hypothetical protein
MTDTHAEQFYDLDETEPEFFAMSDDLGSTVQAYLHNGYPVVYLSKVSGPHHTLQSIAHGLSSAKARDLAAALNRLADTAEATP